MALRDQELIRRALEGDSQAFDQLWQRHEARVVSACRRYLAGPHRDPAIDAEDVATETFIRALHNLNRYEDRSPDGPGFDAWLLEIARRLCLKSLDRRRRRQEWHCDSPERFEGGASDAGAARRLTEERDGLRIAAQEINALPENYRRPFKLSLEEYSHNEIAQILGISVDAAAQRVHRARRMLQPRLAPLFGIAPTRSGGSRNAFRSIERALSEIVRDARIVGITLPSGGEMQLCLRVDRCLAVREEEIDSRRKRLQRHPRAWIPFLKYADLCYHCGRWGEAREAYRLVLSRNPACFAAALRLGEMLRQEEKLGEAERVYQAALEQSPSPHTAMRLQAERLAAEGDDLRAVDAYRAAIEAAPNDRACYYGLNAVLGRLSRYTEQLDNLAALREVAPDDVQAHHLAYTPCARLERWDLALPLMERAVEIDPHHPLALKHLFQVRMNQFLYDEESLALAERLVRVAPEFVESWSELSWIYAELGRDEESLAVLNQFLAEHPGNAEAYAFLSWRYHYLKRPEESASCALRAYGLSPENWHVCWTVLNAARYWPEAVCESDAMRVAVEIEARFPCDAFLQGHVCHLYATYGRKERALERLRHLEALPHDEHGPDRRLADLYTRLNRWPEAVEAYRRLLSLPGRKTPDLLASLGEALRGLRDPMADAAFAEAQALARTWNDFLFLAEAYERCGLRAEAAAAARLILAIPALPARPRRDAETLLCRLGA